MNDSVKWTEINGRLRKDYIFKNFKEAIEFINKVASISEKQDHHPEISNTYNKVSLLLSTHDAGDRVTIKDRVLAEEIDKIAISSEGKKINRQASKGLLFRALLVITLIIIVINESMVIIRDLDRSKNQRIFLKQKEINQLVFIEPWMTFQYVNQIFELPEDYLFTELLIKDQRYPNLEIRRYAKENNIVPSLLINQIIVAIHKYRDIESI